jgi:hypothetical protein
MIAPKKFASFIRDRFTTTGKGITDEAVDRLLAVTGGHPYGTQELAYFAWELAPSGAEVHALDIEEALGRVLRSEHNHFAQLWDDAPHPQRLLLLALADEPTRSLYSSEYHARYDLPANPTLQTALAAVLRKELVGRNSDGEYCVIEPFFKEWLQREQRSYGVPRELRVDAR